jgi:hypothetical protein
MDAPIFNREKRPKGASRLAQLEALVSLLERERDWVTKREIAQLMGVPLQASFARKIRKLAEAGAPVVVSWPGSPGLKHLNFATDAELQHAVNAHRSQAADQKKRAFTYELALKRRNPAPTEQAQLGLQYAS